MTYTLFMPADQGITVAEDGVAEVPMTGARARLTELIRRVRYGGDIGAFTERGQRSAYVVTPDFYERAKQDRLAIAALRKATDRMTPEQLRDFALSWFDGMTE